MALTEALSDRSLQPRWSLQVQLQESGGRNVVSMCPLNSSG